MRKYFEFIRISFKELLAYRVYYFTGITQRLFSLLIQVFVWKALLGQYGVTSSAKGIITIDEMTTYVVVSTLLASLLITDVIYSINDRVRVGQISMDLTKPMNFMLFVLSRNTGWSLFTLIFQLIPVLLIALVSLDLHFPEWQYFLFFLVSLTGAYMIMFFLTFILALFSFWYMRTWQVEVLLDTLITIFSGSWIPLWFFPEIFISISNFLPFRLTYYMPISIYLGKLEYGECWWVLLQQVVWVGILYGIAKLVWNAAIKKLVIQGG